MKLDKLFQSLLLTCTVVVLISTPARSKEVREDVKGKLSIGTVEKSTFNDTITVTDKEFDRKPRHFASQVASSLRNAKSDQLNKNIFQLSEILQSAELFVQSPVSSEVIQVTGVQAKPTQKGVEVILQTTLGEQLQITNRSAENNFIADIPNAQLRLPSGDGFTFRSQNPIEGITEITVTNIDANTIRVTVAGETELPTVELFDSNEGLIFALTPATTAMQPEVEQPTGEIPPEEPAAQQDDSIELVVTGQQESYRVPNTSVGTRTDTPLRDIPQSIQVIPQEVLRDQQVRNPIEALRNVPGVSQGNFSATRGRFINFNIRGFNASNNVLINGLPNPLSTTSGFNSTNIERIEVLRGPASVLYGQGLLGGAVNYVTKQPLSEPYASMEASVGSFNFYRGALDLSGPLNDSRTVLYRLNMAALTTENIVDFFQDQQYFVAPVITWQIGERTRITLDAEYSARFRDGAIIGLPVEGTILPNPNGRVPRNRFLGEPDSEDNDFTIRVGYNLEHQFSENWQIRNAFRYSRNELVRANFTSLGLEDDSRTVRRGFFTSGSDDTTPQQFQSDTYLVGEFSTGNIRHQLVTGFDLTRAESSFLTIGREASPIDLFNPVYGQSPIGDVNGRFSSSDSQEALGVYIQDQVTLAENLKLLLGLRYDTFNQTSIDRIANTESGASGNAFTPRIGIVYQPIESISLYASYSSSFTPLNGATFEGNTFQPESGTQYEVGVKADLNDRLSATLAFYDLTRSNVPTADNRPGVPPGFSIQVGEQRSRGVELSLAGEILPGWNIIGGYAYTDARTTQDNDISVGSRLPLVPENSFNLWTTYEIKQGSLQGLGFGLGLFFVGEKVPFNRDPTFQIPSYLTTDAAIFYRRDRFRAALNIKNLFDVTYFEAALNRSNVVYGEPLTIQGTISWEF